MLLESCTDFDMFSEYEKLYAKYAVEFLNFFNKRKLTHSRGEIGKDEGEIRFLSFRFLNLVLKC